MYEAIALIMILSSLGAVCAGCVGLLAGGVFHGARAVLGLARRFGRVV